MIDMLALALGPKQYNLELREFQSMKIIGRLQFEVDVQQIQLIELRLRDLQVKINKREERPIYASVNSISSGDLNIASDSTSTQKGKFYPKFNHTIMNWVYN